MTDTGQMASLEAEMAGLGAEETMKALCHGLSEALGASSRMPSRAYVRFGCASLEVHWSDAPAATGTESSSAGPTEKTVPVPDGHVVSAELVGRFYRAPEPGAKSFVEVGDVVAPDTQVGIVEAMKLMNPVVAGVAGRVTEILAGDAEPVEYGAPLLVIEPEPEQ